MKVIHITKLIIMYILVEKKTVLTTYKAKSARKVIHEVWTMVAIKCACKCLFKIWLFHKCIAQGFTYKGGGTFFTKSQATPKLLFLKHKYGSWGQYQMKDSRSLSITISWPPMDMCNAVQPSAHDYSGSLYVGVAWIRPWSMHIRVFKPARLLVF